MSPCWAPLPSMNVTNLFNCELQTWLCSFVQCHSYLLSFLYICKIQTQSALHGIQWRSTWFKNSYCIDSSWRSTTWYLPAPAYGDQKVKTQSVRLGAALDSHFSTSIPPPPLHITHTCGISNSDRMQIQAHHRLRMCLCACKCEKERERERGKVRGREECCCIPGEREIPTPSSSLLLLLPIFPPGFPAGGGREGFFLTRAADAGNRLHSERDTGTP